MSLNPLDEYERARKAQQSTGMPSVQESVASSAVKTAYDRKTPMLSFPGHALGKGCLFICFAEPEEDNALHLHAIASLNKLCLPTKFDCGSKCLLTKTRAVEAGLLCVLSHTGATARNIAKYNPQQPTVCITPSDQTARQLCLSRGVYPRVVGSMIGSEQILTHNVSKLVEEGVVKEGQVVICSHGDSHSSPGSTSVMKVVVAKPAVR